ncbi:MAG: hypothetical protein Kow0031_11830 [Anaerolineae bacterium]
MTADLVGKTLGDYTLQEKIGEGGMATVYKADQISLKRNVAIKVLHYREDTSLVRFQREAKAIAALRHRNILIIYEYGEQDNLPFIAMEYVAGGTLEDRLEPGRPMPWRQAIELIIPVAEALHYAHSNGIIHRDVKPSNILMPQDDWPVLADFGLVKSASEEQGLTLSGTFLGTASYIAPEQARDVDMSFRADMYSLGVVLFEMVTGELPFDYENPNKVLLAHVMDPPPNPLDLNPDCPPALADVILKTLEKKPDERYADMQAFIGALREVLAMPAPTPAELTPAAAAPAPAEPEAEGGIGGFFKKLFGRKQEKPAHKPKEPEISSKTAPREQLSLQHEEYEDEGDEDDHTLQLNLSGAGTAVKPRLLIRDKDVTLTLPQKDELIIGRTYGNSTADVDLEPHDASKFGVSRRHARLMRQGDNWLIEDLNSLNGTFVNDREVKAGRPVMLNEGDRIRLSQMHLTFLNQL